MSDSHDSQPGFTGGQRESMVLPPWEDRGRFGLLNALYLTVRRVLLSPGDFFGRMPTELGIGQPLLFALVMGVVTNFFLWMWTVTGSPMEMFAGHGVPFFIGHPFASAIVFIFSPVTTLIQVFVTAFLAHFGMIIFSGNRFGFEATLRVVAYAQAIWLVVVIPVCGWFAAIFWILAVLIIGLARCHEVDPWKAVMAMILPLAFFLLSCAGPLLLASLAHAF